MSRVNDRLSRSISNTIFTCISLHNNNTKVNKFTEILRHKLMKHNK